MPGNLPKTILSWSEPRTTRKACQLANRGRATPRDYFKARCKQVCFFGFWFLLLALLPLFVGKNVLPWPSIVALPIFCGVLLAYFINTIVWIMPQEVRITDRGIQRQRGAGWAVIPWTAIGRIEWTKYDRDGRAICLLLLYPLHPEPGNVPVVIGVAEGVDFEQLNGVLQEQGATVEHAEATPGTPLAVFMDAVHDGEKTDPLPFWRVDGAFFAAGVLAFVVLFLTLPVKKEATGSESSAPQNVFHPDRPRKDANLFVDPAGYQMEVPAGWQVKDHTAKKGVIRADLLADGKGKAGAQVRLLRCSPDQFRDRADAETTRYRVDMGSRWGGEVKEISRETSHTGESDRLTVNFRADRDGGSVWYLQESFIGRGEMMVLLQGGCDWTQRDEFSVTLGAIAHSVCFVDVIKGKE